LGTELKLGHSSPGQQFWSGRVRVSDPVFEFCLYDTSGLSSGTCGAVHGLELLAMYLILTTFNDQIALGHQVKDLQVGHGSKV